MPKGTQTKATGREIAAPIVIDPKAGSGRLPKLRAGLAYAIFDPTRYYLQEVSAGRPSSAQTRERQSRAMKKVWEKRRKDKKAA